MIVFSPFLLLIANYLFLGLTGLALIFIFMRAYSAYLHGARISKDTINYIFYIPELVTGPFRPYSEWGRMSYSNFLERIKIGAILNSVIYILVSGILFTNVYKYFEYDIARSIIIYIALYVQFSNLSNIVNQISIALGLKPIENFNAPLLATSVTNFWERWHVSLGSFAKTHLNQPLTLYLHKKGLKNNIPYVLSIAFTFTFIGLWHNLSIEYLVFGIYFGLLVLFERLIVGKNLIAMLKKYKWIGILYTQTCHIIGFTIVSDYVYAIIIKI